MNHTQLRITNTPVPVAALLSTVLLLHVGTVLTNRVTICYSGSSTRAQLPSRRQTPFRSSDLPGARCQALASASFTAHCRSPTLVAYAGSMSTSVSPCRLRGMPVRAGQPVTCSASRSRPRQLAAAARQHDARGHHLVVDGALHFGRHHLQDLLDTRLR